MWYHNPTREKINENRGRELTRNLQRCSRNCKFVYPSDNTFLFELHLIARCLHLQCHFHGAVQILLDHDVYPVHPGYACSIVDFDLGSSAIERGREGHVLGPEQLLREVRREDHLCAKHLFRDHPQSCAESSFPCFWLLLHQNRPPKTGRLAKYLRKHG